MGLQAKLIRAAAGTLMFLVMLGVVYFVHVRYFLVDVVFYAALADVALATLVSGALLWWLSWFRTLGGFEKLQLLAIWMLCGYALAISVPTVIDRSLSFYILEKIEQRGGGIAFDAFPKVIAEEYMREHRVADVRLTEQLESGTVTIEKGCVVLTDKGRLIAKFSRVFRKNLLPKQRLLLGEYSDDLTDPFRRSEANASYGCTPK